LDGKVLRRTVNYLRFWTQARSTCSVPSIDGQATLESNGGIHGQKDPHRELDCIAIHSDGRAPHLDYRTI
jgi:hypothetical protein